MTHSMNTQKRICYCDYSRMYYNKVYFDSFVNFLNI